MSKIFEWEMLHYTMKTGEFTERAKVFGGWIVKTTVETEEGPYLAVSQVFVPDPNHEWEVNTDNL